MHKSKFLWHRKLNKLFPSGNHNQHEISLFKIESISPVNQKLYLSIIKKVNGHILWHSEYIDVFPSLCPSFTTLQLKWNLWCHKSTKLQGTSIVALLGYGLWNLWLLGYELWYKTFRVTNANLMEIRLSVN